MTSIILIMVLMMLVFGLLYENNTLRRENEQLQFSHTDLDFPIRKQSKPLNMLKKNFDLAQSTLVEAERKSKSVKRRFGKESQQYQRASKHEKLMSKIADNAFNLYQDEWRNERINTKEGQKV